MSLDIHVCSSITHELFASLQSHAEPAHLSHKAGSDSTRLRVSFGIAFSAVTCRSDCHMLRPVGINNRALENLHFRVPSSDISSYKNVFKTSRFHLIRGSGRASPQEMHEFDIVHIDVSLSFRV